MKNPIANLGDYNIAREALKQAGGKWDVLIKGIEKTAVAKKAPLILLIGSGLGILGYKGIEKRLIPTAGRGRNSKKSNVT